MKIFVKIVFIAIVFISIKVEAQHIRSSTMGEVYPYYFPKTVISDSIIDFVNFDQTIYWRKKPCGYGQEKTVYHYHSFYKRDSLLGFRIYGMDIDMMSDVFSSVWANKFRYWNKIRLGLSIIYEKSNTPTPVDDEFYYYYNFDGEISLSYLHISQTSRGDKSTHFRKGSFMLFLLATPTRRIETFFKVNAGGVWIKSYFKRESEINKVGLTTEWVVSKNGYKKSVTHSSKDLYKGITLIAGIQYHLKYNLAFLQLGFKIDLRNH